MTADSLATINEKRASLYWWFSTLFSKELDAEQISHYFQTEGRQLLAGLSQEPSLAKPVATLQQVIARLLPLQHPELELAVDFAELFLCDARKGAPPYASVYLSEERLLFQKPHDEMQALLSEQGLAVMGDFNEPADHLAIQLDYLGNLALQSGHGDQTVEWACQQRDFIKHQLLSWLPQFVTACHSINNTGFYQALADLLLCWVDSDKVWLSHAIEAGDTRLA